MIKNILLLLILLLVANLLHANSITQRGTIEYISITFKKIKVNISVNNVKLLTQTYPLDIKNLKVWANNKRIYHSLLSNGMKIEFRSKKGKIYSIRVLDNNGYNLEPEG